MPRYPLYVAELPKVRSEERPGPVYGWWSCNYGAGRDVFCDYGVRSDDAPGAHGDGPKDYCAGTDQDALLDDRHSIRALL